MSPAIQRGDGGDPLFTRRVPRLVRGWLYLFAAAALILGWVYGLFQLQQFRTLTLEQNKRHLLSIAISLSQHLDAMINDGVGAALTAVHAADVQGGDDGLTNERLISLLQLTIGGGDYVQALFAYSAGEYVEVRRAGGPAVRTPPAWSAALDHYDQRETWAGPSLPDCQLACMPVARKLTTRTGRIVWAGAIISLQSMAALPERLQMQPGVIVLVSADGYLIARFPLPGMDIQTLNERIGKDVEAAMRRDWSQSIEIRGAITGVPMIYQASQVTGTPLAMAVGTAKAVALASWRRQMQITLGLLTAGTATLLALAWLLRRSLTRMEARESQMRALFEHSPLGILLARGDVVIEGNRRAHDLLGASPDTSLTGLSLLQFAPDLQPNGRPSNEVHRETTAALARGGHVTFRTVAKRLDDDALVPLEASLSAQRFGAHEYVLVIFRDMSEIEHANEQLAHLNASLEHRVEERTEALRVANNDLVAMNRELEAFASSASHDLRAPLTTISAMAGILREELRQGSTSAAERRLERIQHAVQRMTEIIEGLLTLAGMTTQSLRREEVNLGAIAQQLAQELRMQYPDRAVEFRCDVDLTVHADPRLMRTLLSNLLSNAWKYSSRAPQPRVEFRQLGANDDTELIVADNGTGFDMQRAEQLFQPFQRLHAHSEYPGIGLGLAIAQRVVSRYGGRIWAHSEPGHGAMFHFTLPAAQRSDSHEDIRHAG